MKENTTFQCLLKPLTPILLSECVKRFGTDSYYKEFNTRNHLLTMIYSQLHEIKSLRDLEIAFNSQVKLRQLMGVGEVSRSTLSDANRNRTFECFLWLAEQLMSLLPRKLRKEINKVVRILDSSPIQLKGLGYDDWTLANRTLRCQGLKLHIEYDGQLNAPKKMRISAANYNDSTMGQNWPITSNTVYVFDKGYYDFNWWWKLDQQGAFFVTRLKNNAAIKIDETKQIQGENILDDATFKFQNTQPRGGKKNLYTKKLRRIVVRREGKEKPLILVTNLLDIPAEVIAELYKERWAIELFFKWIKQNLKVKKYLGRSANAVKIQLASAIILQVLISLLKIVSDDKLSLHQLLIWIRYNSKAKKTIYGISEPPDYLFPIGRFLVNNQGVQL